LILRTGARSRAPPRSKGAEAGVTDKEPNKVTAWRQVGLLTSIPFILALAPIVGYFLGKFLDQKFRTTWLSFVLMALGFVAGVRETIKIVKMSQSED
jgi:F0F1-type ATP synthase assembly protein I